LSITRERRGENLQNGACVCWHDPVTVLRKLNDSNYVLRKGKGKAAVVHVDRMRKLPVSQDVDSSESLSHTHPTDKEPTIPCKQHRTQPATDNATSIQPTDSPSHGYRADRPSDDLTLDKTTDTSQSINVCMPSDLDTCRAWKKTSQSTGTVAETGWHYRSSCRATSVSCRTP